jgi:hypothetical protein
MKTKSCVAADLAIPDGRPLVSALNALSADLEHRVYGAELIERACEGGPHGDAALPFSPHSVESTAGALARVSGDAGLRGAGLDAHDPSHGMPQPRRHRTMYTRVAAT